MKILVVGDSVSKNKSPFAQVFVSSFSFIYIQIHEMFIVDGSDWADVVRDGGAHSVFHGSLAKREMLVAGGKDLQERKRLLVEGADALMVLPGGTGTWDEVRRICTSHANIADYFSIHVSASYYLKQPPFHSLYRRLYISCSSQSLWKWHARRTLPLSAYLLFV